MELSPYLLNDITQIFTAVGVILTAVSSILNRRKLDKVDRKVDQAVLVAVATKVEAINKADEVKAVVREVKEAITNGR
jgi:hypothetical protein